MLREVHTSRQRDANRMRIRTPGTWVQNGNRHKKLCFLYTISAGPLKSMERHARNRSALDAQLVRHKCVFVPTIHFGSRIWMPGRKSYIYRHRTCVYVHVKWISLMYIIQVYNELQHLRLEDGRQQANSAHNFLRRFFLLLMLLLLLLGVLNSASQHVLYYALCRSLGDLFGRQCVDLGITNITPKFGNYNFDL